MTEAVPAPSTGEARGRDRRILLAATLAGLAEAALWSLPVATLARDATVSTGGPLASPWAFVPTFTLGVLGATAIRRSHALPAIAAAAGIAIGAGQSFAGSPDPVGVVLTEVVAIAAALRVAMLATRDWREPVAGSFGWGSAVLLGEVVAARSAGWEAGMAFVVPAFFVCALSSRAVTMAPAAAVATDEAVRPDPRWGRMTFGAVGLLAGGMAAAVALGSRGGVLQGVGRVAIPTAVVVLVVLAFAAVERGPKRLPERGGRWIAAIPLLAISVLIAWVIRQRPARNRAFRIFTGIPLHAHEQDYSAAERVVGLLLVLAIALLLLRAFRSRWADTEAERARADPERPRAGVAPPPGRPPRGRRPRHELPDDTVRRWYAEALLLLREKGLRRPPASTPREFLGEVVAAFPECGSGFGGLTLAYQDVRYGARPIGRGELDLVDAARRELMRTLRSTEVLDDDDDPAGR